MKCGAFESRSPWQKLSLTATSTSYLPLCLLLLWERKPFTSLARPQPLQPHQPPSFSPLFPCFVSFAGYRMKGKEGESSEGIAWELRPGGMLVQTRSDAAGGPGGPLVKIRVSRGSCQHEVSIPSQTTFGELKKVLAPETGLEPQEQRLLFRGKEKDDDERLHMAGIKDMSKVVLLEDPASKERKLEQMKRDQGMLRACEAVALVRAEVDKIAMKVSTLEVSVHAGTKAADKEFVVLTELLMVQLLKLDSIEAEGEAKIQRKFEVRRIQNFVETLDLLKARNSNPFSNSSNAVSVTTQWETFESGLGT